MRLLSVLVTILSFNISGVWAVEKTPMAETVVTFQERPGNPAVSKDGRLFTSVHPLDSPKTKLIEVTAIGYHKPFPHEAYAVGPESKIKATIATRISDNNVAWILDLGMNQLIGWDLNNNRHVKTITIPKDVLVEKSFLQDFALDQKRNRVIIADMSQGDLVSAPQPAFVVVDLQTGSAKRMLQEHESMLPTGEGKIGLNPITIDSQYEWVYYGALEGRTVYRIPASAFDTNDIVAKSLIERYGPKPFSDGITVDNEGNVYITDTEKDVIGVTTPAGYKVVAMLPQGQSWPDGFAFGPDGYIYATVNQLDRSKGLSGEETGTPPYLIVRIKALGTGSTGR